ncbi:MAG: hypothetical protein WCO13_04550 [Bacteroidota bacterium]
MKRFILFFSLLLSVFATNAQNNANDSQCEKFFIGIINTPRNTAYNFLSFDVSDYLRNPSPNDSRAHIPLSDNSLSLPNWGLNVGMTAPINRDFDFMLDLQFSFGNSFNFLIFAGSTFNVIKTNIFSFGPTAKLGFTYSKIELGKVTVSGASSVVNTENGAYYSGDDLSASLYGVAYQLGCTGICKIKKNLSLIGQIGIGGAYLGLMSIDVTHESDDPFKIDLSSKDCVEVGRYKQVDFTPKVKSYGFYYNLGVAFNID